MVMRLTGCRFDKLTEAHIGDIVFGVRYPWFLSKRVEERFLEADLNRVFLEDAPESAEKVRALEMMPLFDDVDLFIDFHQTIEPSEQPFFIFPYHASGYNWARVLEPEIGLVTRDPERAFAQGQVCADEYARGLGIPGITLEMGQKGLTEMAYQLTSHAAGAPSKRWIVFPPERLWNQLSNLITRTIFAALNSICSEIWFRVHDARSGSEEFHWLKLVR